MVVKAVEAIEKDWHNEFCRKVELRYGAYRALKQKQVNERERRGPSWRSDIYQPHLISIIEGMLSTLVESEPAWQVFPDPLPGEPIEQVQARILNAEIAEHKLRSDMRRDKFPRKQRPLIQQDLIAGYTIAKNFRKRVSKDIRYLSPEQDLEWNEVGSSVDVTTRYEISTDEDVLICDGPTMEVRDVRDWFIPGSVTDVDRAPYIIDRTYITMDALRKMEARGVYQNVEYLDYTTTPKPVGGTSREQELRNVDRTKGHIEILEFWNENDVITVGNRSILLRKKANDIFWHGWHPFCVTSAIPEMFMIPGTSVIEGLAQLQDMLWTLQNTRIDILRMLANTPTLIRSDVDDPDMYEWAPLAKWIVDDPGQVSTLPIDPTGAKITLEAESLLKGDIQQLMGGLPFASGASSQTVDQTTATGVSIITNIAQQILALRKQQYLWMYEDVGAQFLSIAQQIGEPDTVMIRNGDMDVPYEVTPDAIQGNYDVRIRMASESMIRKEERAEWQGLLTAMLNGAAASAMSGAPLNIREAWKELFRAFDIPDPERFLLPAGPVQGSGMQIPGVASAPAGPESNGSGTNHELARLGGQSAPTSAEQQMDSQVPY